MPKLLKRGKAPKGVEQATRDSGAAEPDEDTTQVDAGPTAAPEAAPAPPPPMAAESSPPRPAGNGGGNGNAGRPKAGGLLGRMYGEPGEMSRAERERQAAAEFEQAVAPVLDLLVASVPEASSPEEAARAWESRVGELRPDPGAGAYIPGDAFDREARVYYRLLRRDYEKDPRPSLSKNKKVSHHLHSAYARFPGTKGW
jgi:hypothetical protein